MRSTLRFPASLRKILCGGLLALLFAMTPAVASALPASTASLTLTPTFAATLSQDQADALVKECTKANFLGLVPWYKYIGKELQASNKTDKTGQSYKCDVKCFNFVDRGSRPNECGQTKSDVPLVILAIVDNLLRIVGIAAVGYVFYGAIRYTASQGKPDETAKAQSTIVNAVAGVAIAAVAIAFVSYLGNTLGK